MIKFKKIENLNSNSNIEINKNKESKKMKVLKFLWHLILNLIVLGICFKLYYDTLTKCDLTYARCYLFFKHKIKNVFINLVIFTIIMFLSFFITYRKKNFFLLIINIVSVLFLFSRDYHFNRLNHGAFSIIMSICFFILYFSLYGLFKFILIFYRKNRIKTIISLFLIVFFSFLIIIIKIRWDIGKFYKGFDNKILINKGKLCRFDEFKINYYETFGFIFKFFKYIKSPYRTHLEFFDKICLKCEYFSYPQPKDLNKIKKYYIDSFQYDSIKNVVGYKNKEEMLSKQKDREIFIKIDRKKNEAKVFYKPYFNEENIIKKNKLINTNKKYYNVVNIFIDAISREQFFRIFPKTRKFLENNYFKNNNKERLGYGYQFFRAHSIRPWTANNLWAYRYGSRVLSDYRYSLNDIYKSKGYETANFFNSCSFYEDFTFSFNKKYRITPNTKNNQTYYDHDSSSFFCDPNYYMSNGFNIFIGQYSIFRKYIYNKKPYDYNFEFSKNFMEKLKEINKSKKTNIPFFQDLYFVDAHEYTQSVIEYMDDSYYNYFLYLKENEYLNNTIISLFSDHGNHMNPFLFTKSGAIERSSPYLFLLIPEDLNFSLGKYLKENEQKIVTLGDLHKTLNEFIGEKKDEFSKFSYKNIFKEIISEERGCKDLKIPDDYCYCKNY